MQETNDQSFYVALTQELLINLPNWYGSENWDLEVLPYQESLRDRIFSRLRSINQALFRNSMLVKREDFAQVHESILSLEKSLVGLSALYHLLQDDYSRSLLTRLIAYRLMGYRKVKLPLNTASYWAMRKSAHALVKSKATIELEFRNWTLSHMDLVEVGYPIDMFFLPGGVAVTFILKQYEYGKRTPVIKAQRGDWVIDAGGCWGDTALYFAHTVGPTGKVYTFEFAPENLRVLEQNLSMNPSLAERIQIMQKAVWHRSGEELAYAGNGPATALRDDQKGSFSVSTLSIDDFVRENGLTRIDFIKMDIEGAELKALQGAEATLRAFRPQLAISVYHNNQDDLATIPDYLNKLGIGYQFFLDHFTIYRNETVLFATPMDG